MNSASNNNEVIAFIPARGGSKGIPRKNIVPLGGKPLMLHTIEAAIESQLFSKVVVSTDDSEIASVAQSAQATVLLRPEHLATDNATTNAAILHMIEALKPSPTAAICLLQATSPLRNASHIAESAELFAERERSAVYSMVLADKPPQKAFCIKDGQATPLLDGGEAFLPRQQLDDCAYPNGAIYWFEVSQFLKDNCLPQAPIIPYIMSASDSIDIDNIDDLAEAEKQLNESSNE